MKIKNSKSDFIEYLKDEHNFLKGYCQEYDKGNEKIAKKIASSLRILLYDTKNSTSLLAHLQIKDTTKFLDTASPYNEKNAVSSSCLTYSSFSHDFDGILPFLGQYRDLGYGNYKYFLAWWGQIVLDDKKNKFSRGDIILSVANKDGGVHVDSELPEDYYNLTRENSMGWVVRIGSTEKPLQDFCFASIRQIAFEVDITLDSMHIDLWKC